MIEARHPNTDSLRALPPTEHMGRRETADVYMLMTHVQRNKRRDDLGQSPMISDNLSRTTRHGPQPP